MENACVHDVHITGPLPPTQHIHKGPALCSRCHLAWASEGTPVGPGKDTHGTLGPEQRGGRGWPTPPPKGRSAHAMTHTQDSPTHKSSDKQKYLNAKLSQHLLPGFSGQQSNQKMGDEIWRRRRYALNPAASVHFVTASGTHSGLHWSSSAALLRETSTCIASCDSWRWAQPAFANLAMSCSQRVDEADLLYRAAPWDILTEPSIIVICSTHSP